MSRLRRFSIWHAALLTPWLIAGFGFARSFNDNSYLWHVRAGDLQLERGSVLTADPFSFTMAGEPWRTQSWLAELLYSRLDAWGGLGATPLITAACAALTFILLGLVAYRRSRSVISVVLYLVASSVALAAFINPRPVIFSFPLFAAVVLADDERRIRWALPLLMWVWASVHGSFFIGLAYLGIMALIRGLDRKSMVRLVITGGTTLVTAHGLGIVSVLFDFAGNREAVAVMSEWQTPNLLSPPFIPVFLGILALIWLAQQGSLKKREWLLFVPFLALALSANRSVPPAWIALAPIMGRFTLPLVPSRRGGPLSLVLSAVLVAAPFVMPSGDPIDATRFPVEAASYLETDRVFHDDAVGGWLIYQQWPDRLVYVDDRAELYGGHLVRSVEARMAGSVWAEEFQRWEIDEALLSSDASLAGVLTLEGWTSTYRDESFVILRARED